MERETWNKIIKRAGRTYCGCETQVGYSGVINTREREHYTPQRRVNDALADMKVRVGSIVLLSTILIKT